MGKRAGQADAPEAQTVPLRSSLLPLAGASILALAALFLMRFTFYMSHLTVGLGV